VGLARQEAGGGEVRVKAFHGLQSILGAVEDVPPKRREVLEAAPILPTAQGGGKSKWELRVADRDPRMEQGTMPGPARLNSPLDS
jgi:hypothetical protein